MENPALFFIKLLSFAAAFLGVIGLNVLLFGKKREEEYGQNLPLVFRLLQTETKYLSGTIGDSLAHAMPSAARNYRNLLQVANMPKLEASDIFGAQVLWLILLGAAGALLSLAVTPSPGYAVLAFLAGAFLGWEYPSVAIQQAADKRQKLIRKNLPFSIDLITSAMQAGLDFIAAVRYYVNNSGTGPLQQEYGVVLKEIELGKSRIDALRGMSARIQIEEFKGLVTAVAEGAEMGASIVETLRIHAEEIRRARYAAAERQAQRAPSLMLIPMALFIMPAVFIIIFTPVFIRIQDSGFSQMF